MIGPSPDRRAYFLDESANRFTLTPGFLASYPQGLFALGGKDYIIGSTDSEPIDGGDSDDRLIGGIGNDSLFGGADNDFLSGGKGKDVLIGDTGTDLLRGGQGDDSLMAFEGDDVLVGEGGRDTLVGGEGTTLLVLPTESAVQNPADADVVTNFKHAFWKKLIGLTGGLTEADLDLQAASLTPGSSDTLIRVRQSGAILGWVQDVTPDYLKNRFVSADAKLGDELLRAIDLGSLTQGSAIRQDFVNSRNPDRFYRFQIPVTSDVRLSLTGLSADADVTLIEDLDRGYSVENADILQPSNNPDTQPEEMAIDGLLPGTYYLRVSRFEEAETNYILGLAVTPTDPVRAGSEVNKAYNVQFGYGLANAAAAVASAVNQAPFSDVPNLQGDDWPRDLIQAPEVWAKGITGNGIVVAVIDTGVDYNHPDLASNIWRNVGETGLDPNGQDKTANGIDDDRNGFIDDVRGWDFVENDNTPTDENGHGTHIAGIIGAKSDGVGITGVAPNVTLMPIRAVNRNGSGKVSNGVSAIRYAADNGAQVINLSLGGEDMESDRRAAVEYARSKGVVVVSAAGNEGRGRPVLPARLANTVGLAVGSIERTQKLSTFSNRSGPAPLKYVVAPGGANNGNKPDDILSTVPLENSEIPYRYYYGTSMAAPHVSGLVALIRQVNPTLTPAQVEQIVINTANRSGVIVEPQF